METYKKLKRLMGNWAFALEWFLFCIVFLPSVDFAIQHAEDIRAGVGYGFLIGWYGLMFFRYLNKLDKEYEDDRNRD